MTTFSQLLDELPAMSGGVPMGSHWQDDYIGWRFFIQVATTPAGSVLGTMTLGPAILGGPRWLDVTADCQGLSWTRGGTPAQRPIAGELNLRLNNKPNKYHPFQNTYFGPGTLLRVIISNGISMHYCFTGLTQSWKEGSAGLAAYEWVDIVAWEPMFLLNEVNDNALLTPLGAGDTLAQRIDRLLTLAEWQFGTDVLCACPGTFQATNLGQVVATEVYLSVDSVDSVVWSGVDGRLHIRERRFGTGVHWQFLRVFRDPDTTVFENNDDRLLSAINLARTGGSETLYTNVGLAGRYQKRTTKRDGLVTQAEAGDGDLARVAAGVLGRATQAYRPVEFAVDCSQNHMARRLLVEADITDRVTIDRLVGTTSRVIFSDYAICSLSVGVTVTLHGTHWTGTIGLDIEVDSHWSQTSGSLVWGRDTWGAGKTWGPRSYVTFPVARWGVSHWGTDWWSQ